MDLLIRATGGVCLNIYLARQPIFNRSKKVIAYELLYRSGETNVNLEKDGTQATTMVISNTLLEIGLDKVSRGNRLFINFNKELIDNRVPFLLPKEQVAIEISEDTITDGQTIEVCKELKKEGYTLVLDDFNLDSQCKELLDYVDVVKIDFLNLGAAERSKVETFLKNSRAKLLAEKIETAAEFESAVKSGYLLFQGFFFCKPVIITSRSISANKMQSLRLVQEIYKPEMDVDHIEAIIKQDPALTYKLLRFVNSPAFPLRFEISSIRQAVALLGQKELLKWVSLVALRNLGYDKPDELIVAAVTRARFCETMAKATRFKRQSADLFLTGLFSLLDTFLDQPMEDALANLPLAEEVKQALLGNEGDYRSILDIVLFYEKGQWNEAFNLAATRFNLDEMFAMNCYLESVELADASWE